MPELIDKKRSDNQVTINRSISISGIGLHGGKDVQLTMKPAPPDTGILFRRIDLPEEPAVRANISKVKKYERETTIGENDFEIHMVEHLLATLYAVGVDNMIIEMDGDEVPILDGSARPYIDMLEKVGLNKQDRAREVYNLSYPLKIYDGDRFIAAFPHPSLKISFVFDYKRPFMKKEYISIEITPENFKTEIAPARTFCVNDEIEYLRNAGLIKGGSLENALVFSPEGVMNPEGLYFDDECVRHKILDLIGDISLISVPIRAHIIAICSGHSLNQRISRRIFYEKERMFLPYMKPFVPDKDQLGLEDIKKLLPHRYPFLLVDRILSIDAETQTIIGIKNVTGNEAFFQGHFPEYPIMPGVLIIEAMAQVGGILLLSQVERGQKQVFFMGLDKVKFRKSIIPGDQVIFEVKTLKFKKKTAMMFGRAYVSGTMVAQAELKFAMGNE